MAWFCTVFQLLGQSGAEDCPSAHPGLEGQQEDGRHKAKRPQPRIPQARFQKGSGCQRLVETGCEVGPWRCIISYVHFFRTSFQVVLPCHVQAVFRFRTTHCPMAPLRSAPLRSAPPSVQPIPSCVRAAGRFMFAVSPPGVWTILCGTPHFATVQSIQASFTRAWRPLVSRDWIPDHGGRLGCFITGAMTLAVDSHLVLFFYLGAPAARAQFSGLSAAHVRA